MSNVAIEVKILAKDEVRCPRCVNPKTGLHRYIGAFVGRAKCDGCGKWVDSECDRSTQSP